MNASLLEAFVPSSEKSVDMACRQSVIDNIRLLLESRQCLIEVPDYYPRVQSALYGYGLSVRHLNRSHYQANKLCQEIEQLLRQYEPRLKDVLVEMVQINEQVNCIRFRIEGILPTEDGQKVIGLDSELNLTDARLNIMESSFV